LIPALKDATNSNRIAAFTQSLSNYAEEKEAEIEQIGLTKHEEFLQSVNQLQKVREGTVVLTSEILQLNQSIQASTEGLAGTKEKVVEVKSVGQNIGEATEAIKDALKILYAANSAQELIRKRKYYAALKALEDLQNEHLIPILQNKYATQHKMADVIQKAIPSWQKQISDAVMNDLNTWLYRIRETSQFLGEVAFYHTSLRQKRQKERSEKNPHLKTYSLNSAIELVYDESEEFDVLDNDEVKVEFVPLFEAIHIHQALRQSDKFRQEYAATRRQQKDLLLPAAITLVEDDENGLSSLLEAIAGFAIIEKATMKKAPNLRSPVDVSLPPWETHDADCHRLMSFGIL
jgi:exocyst complex component 6